MYLNRLELRGFKTFVGKTDLIVHPGVTAIVGPNGSGKSNIVDALRWVLGEQSLSTVRCRKTEDLIFSGSAGHSQTGMAEVALSLDNSDHYLDIDFSEATIARRAYRSGENEYLVNRNRVRLKDLVELMTPLRPGQAFVGQGQVDAMLSLHPEERRRLIEDAAQLGLYKLRRADAERQLSRVNANAVRAKDLLADLEPRLRALKRQARRTEARRNLEARLAALTRSVHLRRWQVACSRLEEATAREQETRVTLSRTKEDFDERLRLAETAAAELEARQLELSRYQEERYRTSAELEHAERDIAVGQERLANLRHQLADIEMEVRSVEEARADEAAMLAKLSADVAQFQREMVERRKTAEILRAKLASAGAAQVERQQTVAVKQAALQEADLKLSGLRRELERTTRRRLEVDGEIDRKQSALSSGENEHRTAAEKRQRLVLTVEDCENALSLASERRDVVAGRLKEARQAFQRAEGDLRELRERQRAARVRQELAREAQESYSGYPRAVQQLLGARASRKSTGLSGLVGTVGELLEVPGEYEVAVETALGGHVFDIVARRWEDAEAGIEYLKSEKCGRCTFLPLDTVPRTAVQPISKSPGMLGLAFDLVKFDPIYTNVFAQLLGRVVVVDDMPAAHRLLPKTRPGYVLVTVTGEVVRMSGSITGGHVVHSRLLGRVRESREGDEEVRDMDKRVAVAQSKVNELTVQVSRLETEMSVALQQTQQAESECQSTRSSLSELDDLLQLGEKESRWLQSLVQRLINEREDLNREASIAREQIAQAENDCRGIRLELDAHTEREAGSDHIVEEISRATSAAETEAGVLQSRLDRSSALIPVHKTNLEKLEARAQSRLSHAEAIGEQISLSEKAQLEAEERRVRLRAVAAQADVAHKPLAETIRRLREEAHQLDRDVSDTRERVISVEEDLRQASIEVERCRAEVRQEEGQSWPETDEYGRRATDPYAEMDVGYLEAEVESCRSELEQVGPVNWMAEEEHRDAEVRYSFLDGQVRDLAAAQRSLEDLLAELDETAEKRLVETFQLVAAEFGAIFSQLFSGGTAELRLVKGRDGQGAGVEIFVQPPGKRSQSLSLLSGGERALSSIALLFAMLKASPSPFYVLDEVDAALDEANVRRFAQLLQQLAKETQFIVITHNRATIEASDILYGVFMADNSTSRLLSLSMSEAQHTVSRNNLASANPS